MKRTLRKKLKLTFLLGLTACSMSFAQTSIGLHGTLNEYDGDLSDKNFDYYKFKTFQPGWGVSLQQNLNSSFNLVEKFSFNQVQYDNKDHSAGVDADFFLLNLKLKYKFDNGYIFNKDAVIAPFLVGGIGASYVNSQQWNKTTGTGEEINKGEILANLAAGGGVLFRVSDRVGIELANTVQMPLNDSWDGQKSGDYNDVYLQHSVGLIYNLTKAKDSDGDGVPDKKDKCDATPTGVAVDSKGCPLDLDGDGTADYLDKCPSAKGTAALNGCPDEDGDGVADKDDKCPNVAGLARFAGCPDTDGDGVEDAKDKCPNQNGLDIFQGCPDTDGDGVEDAKDKCSATEKGIKVDETGCPADTDKDGVIDSKDKCPNTAGDAINNGCPLVKSEVKKRLKFATRGINFETGKATLKTSSNPMLDEIVAIMNEYKDYILKVGGHTDNVGAEETNLTLSQNRVDAVKSYLVSKGVSENRIVATGYGETKPIASNKTATGKAQNRRVEIELVLKD